MYRDSAQIFVREFSKAYVYYHILFRSSPVPFSQLPYVAILAQCVFMVFQLLFLEIFGKFAMLATFPFTSRWVKIFRSRFDYLSAIWFNFGTATACTYTHTHTTQSYQHSFHNPNLPLRCRFCMISQVLHPNNTVLLQTGLSIFLPPKLPLFCLFCVTYQVLKPREFRLAAYFQWVFIFFNPDLQFRCRF
jgi:hypothetical protein